MGERERERERERIEERVREKEGGREREREREGKIHTRDQGFLRLGASERRKQSNVLEWSTGVD